MYSIILDRNNQSFVLEYDMNLMYVRMMEKMLNDQIRTRGYLYMNQIYEAFGLKWDPEQENICIKHKEGRIFHFEFEVFRKENDELYIVICLPEKEP